MMMMMMVPEMNSALQLQYCRFHSSGVANPAGSYDIFDDNGHDWQ